MDEIIEKHVDQVRALGYTEEQSRDLIHRLSTIMTAFIDAAWGVHPAQLAKEHAFQPDSARGKLTKDIKNAIGGPPEAKPSAD